MPTKRQNGIQVPVGSDPYALTGDLGVLADSTNVIIPVLTVAERNALTPHEGMHVSRLDRQGVLDKYVNGSWKEGDTGWVNMTYVAGFSAGVPGQMAYKVAGGTLHIKGGAQKDTGSFASFAYTDVTSTLLPVEFRPAATVYFGSMGTGGRAAGIQISSTGLIRLVTHHGDATWISAACSIPLT